MQSALSHPVYRRLLLAQILSVLGSGLTTIALGLLAFDLAGADAGVVLGTALTIKMVAYVGLAPVAAAVSARMPRRGFLIGLDVARASLVLALPFVTEIWQIYALVFGFQAFSAAFTPTFQATIPDILEDEAAYTQALSYARLTYDLESLLAPMLAGAILAVTSFHALFGGTAIGFLASAALVASVRLPDRKAGAPAPFRKRVTRGIWIYFATPRLRGLLALYVAVAAATAMVIVNTVVRVKADLGYGDQMVALHFAASGIGSMAVALVLPRVLGQRAPRPVMLLGGGVLISGLMLAGLGPGVVAGLLLWAMIGAGAAMIQTPAGVLITRSCHAEDRPALFAAQFALSHAAWLLAYPLAGGLGAALGLSSTFWVMAGLAAGGTFAAMRLWPADDPAQIEHEHPAPDAHTGDQGPVRHSHAFVIDDHHPAWPRHHKP
ncbi:MFS transporter [Tropicibacter naphthalenivorans]|uniref:Enterobactin exporter EntS n=1 Tax=Tropicibacter naphthalenivorans TaxID=441103 RepID=A0A0N7M021_9RHOB|nr:MFS transporter [Tropicibacter naphthalenivorans]CUH79249.1 enterobactin exporter EntS [Tropicibacter naphthalenivorans]SMC70859.1 Predicted arabinose efflux permease, MFS family [Tropicibacter naphthalenivorans]